MNNHQVADVLEEIAALLEVRGENPFKSRAYEKITTLVRSGRLQYHEELRAAIPPVLLDLLRIPGLGPRKARLLVDRLGISGLGELEYACHENRLAGLDGFGQKSQDKVLRGIERLKQYASRFLLGDALPLAEDLAAALAALPGVRRASYAGALRRREETVGEVMLLAAGDDPAGTLDAFAALPALARVAERGDRRLIGTLAGGIPVSCRAVPDEAFACALLHLTGSAAHLEGLRPLAGRLGQALDESGLWRAGRRIPTPTEESVYQALGIAFVPPELREGRGEIEAAAEGRLPALLRPEEVRGILHVHSTWSDGRLSIEEIVRRSADLGYEYVGITDRSRSARYARGLTPESLRQQQMQIDEARARHPRIRVLKGSEVDVARRAGLTAAQVLNTVPAEGLGRVLARR